MGRIYYLMGKSASGKDTISDQLILKNPRLKKYVMYTTRPQRYGEVDGKTYHFITLKDLENFSAQGRLIEKRTYQTIEGSWVYATVDDGQMDPENVDILAEGTIESFLKIRSYFGKERVVPLYIEVEDGERLQRALNRERQEKFPAYREMCRRFLADSDDFSKEQLEKAGINKKFENADVLRCVEEILGVMQ